MTALNSQPPARTPRRMVILQLIPELETGGAERGCVDMAAAIQRAGGRALVISAGGKLAREVEEAGAKHICWPSIKSKNPFIIMMNAQKVQKLVAAENVAIIHVRSRAPAWVGYIAARRAGVPFLTTFHSTYNFKSKLKQFYNSVMARGDRVIAISDFIRRHILQNYQTPAEHIRLVHRGIDIERFDPARVDEARTADLRAKWKLPEGKKVILLPGRLTRWKGQATLVAAMAELADPNTVAVCVGSDQGRSDYRRQLEEDIAARNLQGRVLLPGDCIDMPAAYALADVVVSASVEPEAFGRVIVEAQAMGKPVVVSDTGAVAETAGATGFGWIVPPADAPALARALRDVLALPESERAARAAIARDYILGHYTKDKMCAATLAVYRELLAV